MHTSQTLLKCSKDSYDLLSDHYKARLEIVLYCIVLNMVEMLSDTQ